MSLVTLRPIATRNLVHGKQFYQLLVSFGFSAAKRQTCDACFEMAMHLHKQQSVLSFQEKIQ